MRHGASVFEVLAGRMEERPELNVLLDAPSLAEQIVGQFEGLVREQKLLRLPVE